METHRVGLLYQPCPLSWVTGPEKGTRYRHGACGSRGRRTVTVVFWLEERPRSYPPDPEIMSISASEITPTLLFIPDISGFTEFVNDTEITHSRHIIEELLETLIDANELDLEISEIEGDAVLFCRAGPAPTAAALLAQVERMYVAFHGHLRRYETHRICHCGACTVASGLTLKFIVHYGEVGKNRIKDHSKLFGRDVIVAHRLLKNELGETEYVLMTDALVRACANWVDLEQTAWADPREGESEYDVGSISYCHISLEPLRAQVPEPVLEHFGLEGPQMEVMAVESVIEAPADLVFDVLADLGFRHHWQAGLKGSDRLSQRIAGHGATHRCVIQDSEKDPFVVSHDFRADEDLITFTDTEHRQGWSAVYRLRRIDASTTRLEQHQFLKKSVLLGLIFRFFLKRKLLRATRESHRRLNEYCKALVRQGRAHPSRIMLQSTAEPVTRA